MSLQGDQSHYSDSRSLVALLLGMTAARYFVFFTMNSRIRPTPSVIISREAA